MEQEDKSLDFAGFGKIAKAIPPKVYEQSCKSLLATFEKLTAPITETTSGLGRYLRQKFDNMVDAEKAIAAYTLEKAVTRAKKKAQQQGLTLISPNHFKSFVKAIEEASKETDPFLHEMWTNLLASQLLDGTAHPHFVEILSHFSPSEAKTLMMLLPKSEIGENNGGYFYYDFDEFTHWVPKAGDQLQPWTLSCVLLCEFHFADVVASKGNEKKVPILFRTASGAAFLRAVTTKSGHRGLP